MSLGTRIADLRKERGWNQPQLAKQLHIGVSTLGMWETDQRKPNADALVDLANLLDASVDYLVGNSDKRHFYSLTAKDQRSIDKQLEEIMNGLTDKDSVSFMKENPDMSEHDRELLAASLRTSLELAREMAKKKFTPNKYKGSEGK